jgi:hypothetical protein
MASDWYAGYTVEPGRNPCTTLHHRLNLDVGDKIGVRPQVDEHASILGDLKALADVLEGPGRSAMTRP